MAVKAPKQVLLFGPQALSFKSTDLQDLISWILSSHEYAWMFNAVLELPDCLQKVISNCPTLANVSQSWVRAVERLQQAFISGKASSETHELPNCLLSPLVVLFQLIQYVEYRRQLDPNDTYSPICSTKILGFCTGQLGALVVSSSSNQQTFARYGAAAIRLALVVGLIVDVQDDIEKARSFATICHTDAEKEMMANILKDHQAYVSVYYDENRATVTTSATSASTLQKNLQSMNITVSEIGLRGRFHWPGHQMAVDEIVQFCDKNEDFQCASAPHTMPIYPIGNSLGDKLHLQSIRSILLEPLEWYDAFSAAYRESLQDPQSTVVCFGQERCIPPSFLRHLGSRIHHVGDHLSTQCNPNEDKIAVIGMSCKVAGADDLDEYWNLLCEGKSQHKEVPQERFRFDTVHRETDGRKWYGNFMNNHDAFDHKFFKKTPREAVSMDPQQRQILQIAYQAVEQSGYLRKPVKDPRIGCFVGVCSTDYEDNIACHAPTAYSATGHLRGFIAGKVSHFFGWTGPGLTIDTACSSSAVAVHQACRSILSGECVAAIAGGSHVMTSPLWYQNLAGASFLSKTGSCKPFDAAADGYCRGEGVAAVFLKKLSDALKDGDQIFGVIAGTAVQQNENCTPIVVPNVPSLSNLFENVLAKAQLRPEDITVVEAHGTGTPIGDPAEFESIRSVLATTKRTQQLALGSVKGLIGHCECTSGIVSLIKILLMINRGTIPPQASFKTLNPAIQNIEGIYIPRELAAWNSEFRAALINNYGASGSNASLVVTQPPHLSVRPKKNTEISIEHPICFSGLDDRGLQAYTTRMARYLQQHGKDVTLADLAFRLSRQNNQSLERHIIFSCRSLDEMKQKLSTASQSVPQTRPVILCFGGQISKFVGLDPQIYEQSTSIRKELDECDLQCTAIGIGSIFPEIFQRVPIEDTVKLQTCLFALQYACAKTWIASGVQPSAVIGHSFGELTSLCVAGILSLEDAILMIAKRARIIRDSWSLDRGAMIAVEGDEAILQGILNETNKKNPNCYPASIACYNTPTSFTVAGSTPVIDEVANELQRQLLRHKRLNVTHAFHSALVDPLMSQIRESLAGLRFHPKKIRTAPCSLESVAMTPDYFANHLRNPVFFSHAAKILTNEFPNAIWIEAGSNSTITNIVKHAIPSGGNNHFQAINITSDNAWSHLSEATMNLWRAGVNMTFWAHEMQQSSTSLQVPPYQFELNRHWLELKTAPKLTTTTDTPVQNELIFFLGYQDQKQKSAKFRVNTSHPRYQELMTGHVVAHTAPILPATVQVDLAIESLLTILPHGTSSQPQLLNVQNDAAICTNPSSTLWLSFEKQDLHWDFRFASSSHGSNIETVHTRGEIHLRQNDDHHSQLEFERYSRLVPHSRCQALLRNHDARNIMQGHSIYKTFSEVVDYDAQYRGVQKIVGGECESAAQVSKQYTGETWFDAHLSDTFCQVIGIWVNYMADCEPSNICIAKGFEKWARSPQIDRTISRPSVYNILATHQKMPDGGYVSDLFVFHPDTGDLLEFVLGFRFIKIAKASLVKILVRLTNGSLSDEAPAERPKASKQLPVKPQIEATTLTTRDAQDEVFQKLKDVIAELSGIEREEISEATELVDIGIDSLMGMELISELERAFKCSLPEDEIASVTDIGGTLKCLLGALDMVHDVSEDDDSTTSDETDSSEPESEDTQLSTPMPKDDPMEQKILFQAHPAVESPELAIPYAAIIDAFNKTCELTDQFILDSDCADYVASILPEQNALCTAFTLDAFAELGSSIKSACEGERVQLFNPLPEYSQLVRNLCEMLEKTAGLVTIDGEQIFRTNTPLPASSGKELLQIMDMRHSKVNQLIYYVGSHLTDVFRGKVDGVKLIFGRPEGRELVSSLYGDWIMNRPFYRQMEYFLKQLVSKLPTDGGPIKILEMGAGTGGTTKWLVPLLASLNYPTEYTFTDLSPSFVAAARKNFKDYPFMKFCVHDIEKEPSVDLHGQHMVIASNAVHATHSLVQSASNIRKALRPNGILMMLEMIEPLYWIDMIFGLFEGWWFFDDGRKHALTPTTRWKTDLEAAGFGYVNWSSGTRPEAEINKVIVAVAGDAQVSSDPSRQAMIDGYVSYYTRDFRAPEGEEEEEEEEEEEMRGAEECFLVTGATGSTGSHLVGELCHRETVRTIICLNRRSQQDARTRQLEALSSRGITVPVGALAKLEVYETDASCTQLGLSDAEYARVAGCVTHIIHNAWPMSIKRPLAGFEAQFATMQQLTRLACDAAAVQQPVHFQLVSSIAAVGAYPGGGAVPEERMPLAAVLHMGYAEAKHVCERMLEATLHRHPRRFRASVVRLGQVAGSSRSGYWNAAEHLPFLWKSAQALGALPALRGPLAWTPVDDVAVALVQLARRRRPCAVYHVDHPVRQTWDEMILRVADALGIAPTQIIPFERWTHRLRQSALGRAASPAAQLADFLDRDFRHMSCGGLMLATSNAVQHSPHLAAVQPVSPETTQRYFDHWRRVGFLA